MDEHEFIQQSGALAGISVLAANVRIILLSDRYTIVGAIRASILAGFAGLTCWFYMSDVAALKDHDGWKISIICICGVLAEDILRGVLRIGKEICSKPLDFFLGLMKRGQ